MQAGIHAGQAVLQNDTFPLNDPRRSTRPIPRGWPNAILGKNTWPFYNYTITTTKGTEWQNNCTSNIYRLKLNLDAGITSSIGILYDNIGLLGRLEFGWYDQRYFSNESSVVYDMKESKKDRYVDFSFLFNIEKTYWLYNATLQGYPGESDQSPFKLKKSELENFTFFYEWGFRLRICKFYCSYLKAFRTPTNTLDANRNQSFGRISVIFKY